MSSRLCHLALGVVLVSGCGTVDPGPDTGPPQGCNASASYFVSDAWPRYFEKYQCGKSDCHDASSGHGYFRLQSVAGLAVPQATSPIASWPTAWVTNLRSAQRNLSCSSPLTSAILVVPSGRGQPHPPGVTVTDLGEADDLFRTWLR